MRENSLLDERRDWLSDSSTSQRENSVHQPPFSRVQTTKKRRKVLNLPIFGPVMMASPSQSPELPVKKETVSFAPPPAELNLPRITLNSITATDDQPREHPDSSHRRSSLADSSGSARKTSS